MIAVISSALVAVMMFAPAGDNGTLYVESDLPDRAVIRSFDLGADGSASNGLVVYDQAPPPLDSTVQVLAGREGLLLTGRFAAGFSTSLTLRDPFEWAAEDGTVSAPSWCGGEGGTVRSCVLLGGRLVARTSTLGAGAKAGRITVNSLDTGRRVRRVGPLSGLMWMGGAPGANTVVVGRYSRPTEPQAGNLLVQRINVRTGRFTRIARVPASEGSLPACTLPGSAVLLWQDQGGSVSLRVAGSRAAGPYQMAADSAPFGCSKDGRFAYLVHDGDGDEEAVVAVDLATGAQRDVITGSAGQFSRLTVTN